MRRVLLIARAVDDEALDGAVWFGATEIVVCRDGEPPPGLAGLAMGYHEIAEVYDETDDMA